MRCICQAIICLLLAGCGYHGKNALYPAFDQPRRAEDVNITVERLPYLDMVQACGREAEKQGKSKWTIYASVPLACAIPYTGPYCKIYTATDAGWVMAEEIRHCEGWER